MMMRCPRLCAGYGALVLTAALVPGIAQSAPESNRLWAQDCTLSSGSINTVQGLIDDMAAAGSNKLGTPQVAFVVVYTFENNDGQRLNGVTDPEGPHTGPVVCRNTAVTASPTPVLQTDDIGSGNVDILDLENAISLRYRLNDANIEKRFCHSVETNSDCYLFVPSTP